MAYYGKYRGVVKEINDPEKRGRIRVECPTALGKQLSAWALPNFPPNQASLPSKDSLVWIEFEGGRIDSPIWTGVFYTASQWAKAYPDINYSDIKGNVAVSKSMIVPKDLKVTGNMTLKGNLTMEGNITTDGDISSKGDVSAVGNISAGGSISAGGTVSGTNI